MSSCTVGSTKYRRLAWLRFVGSGVMADQMSSRIPQRGVESDVTFGHAQYLSDILSNAVVWNHLLEPIASAK